MRRDKGQGTRVECSDFGFVDMCAMVLEFWKLEARVPAVCCVISCFSCLFSCYS